MGFRATAHLSDLNVEEPYRRQGIASMLLTQAITLVEHSEYPHLGLDVVMSNHPAINLYRKFGFVKSGSFYNVLCMRKYVTSASHSTQPAV